MQKMFVGSFIVLAALSGACGPDRAAKPPIVTAEVIRALRPGSTNEMAIEYRIGPSPWAPKARYRYEVVLAAVQGDSELVSIVRSPGPRRAGPMLWRSDGVGPVVLRWVSRDSLTVLAHYYQWKRHRTVEHYSAGSVRVGTFFVEENL